MAKRNKYIQKALDYFNWDYDNKEKEFPLNTLKDIDFLIKQCEGTINDYEVIVQEYQEAIETAQKNIENLKMLKDQAEVEEFKEMNPKAKSVFKI